MSHPIKWQDLERALVESMREEGCDLQEDHDSGDKLALDPDTTINLTVLAKDLAERINK